MPDVFSPLTAALPAARRRPAEILRPFWLILALLVAALAAAGGGTGVDWLLRAGEPPSQQAEPAGAGVTASAVAEGSSIAEEAPAASAALQEPPSSVEAASQVPAQAAAPQPSLAERWRREGILLEMDGQEWDEASLANVDAALSRLPPTVRASLGNPALGPLHILVNTQGRSLAGNQPYGRTANFFSTNDGVNELVLYPGQSVATVLHELGHAYNLRAMPAGRYALVLLEPEATSFMAATGWHLLSSPEQVRTALDQTQVAYAYDGAFSWPRLSHADPLEDFANSFALYFLDPARLKETSPVRFDWFAANLGS